MVLERFNSTPHGGTEFAGVLFGSHTGEEVRISAFRPISGGGAFAYAAALAGDQRALAEVMEDARTSDELAGLEPLGWFRAHPRSGLDLSNRDLEISNALFAEPWQVAMIMRPGNSAATRVRFFFRDTEGPWKPECSFRESIVPAPAEPLFSSDAPSVRKAPVAAKPPVVAKQPVAETRPGPQVTRSEDIRQLVKGLERRAVQPPASRLPVAWPVALAVIAGLVGSLYWWMRPDHIALRVLDSAGQLRVSWNGTASQVRNGRAAHLEITDGGEKLWIELAREQLRNGNVDYTRRSGNVMVRLVVQPEDGPPVEEVASFIGPVVQTPAERAQAQLPGETGSRERSVNPPRLVVQVPVEQAPVEQAPVKQAPPERVRPKFTAPPVKTAQTRNVTVPPAPELAAPPLAARETPVLTSPPPVRMESPPQKPAPARPSPANSADTPPITASTPAQIPARAPAAPRAPTSGRVIWTGRLPKNQPLTIMGKNCSTGTVIGELPARPFKFSLSPGDLSSDGIALYTSNLQYANNVVEPPGAENGWNKTVYTWNPKYANDVSVVESPAQANQWSRIVLRSKNPKISVIVIDWTLVN
jgi:hypothetical protein